jgi:hypothetical protein
VIIIIFSVKVKMSRYFSSRHILGHWPFFKPSWASILWFQHRKFRLRPSNTLQTFIYWKRYINTNMWLELHFAHRSGWRPAIKSLFQNWSPQHELHMVSISINLRSYPCLVNRKAKVYLIFDLRRDEYSHLWLKIWFFISQYSHITVFSHEIPPSVK